jgi:N-acyl-L-homoserine lactone synthetase
MMQLLSGAPKTLPVGLYEQAARYRQQVFVERLGWELQTSQGMEADQFDRPDTVYVVAQNDQHEIIGCARLLPTHRPYLLGEVFPQLMNSLPVPCSPDVWELSRFAAGCLDDTKEEPVSPSLLNPMLSPIAEPLLREAIRYAAAHGAKRLITVSPLGVERLLRRAGIEARRAGPPVLVEGSPVIACWIDI